MTLGEQYYLKLYEQLSAQGFQFFSEPSTYRDNYFFIDKDMTFASYRKLYKDTFIKNLGSDTRRLDYRGKLSEAEINFIKDTCYMELWREVGAEQKKDSFIFTKIISGLFQAKLGRLLHLCESKQEFIDFFSSFSIKDATIGHVHLREIEPIMRSKGFNDNDIDKFFLSFIKQRKNQTKDTKNSVANKDFLIEYYQGNIDKLSAFYDYFPLLKSQFEDVAVDFEEASPPIITGLLVNLKKMVTSFPREKTGPREMYNHLALVMAVISEKYQAQYRIIEESTNSLTRILMFHNNPELTQEVIRQNIIKCFKMLSANPEIKVDKVFLSAYFAKEDLSEKLSQKPVSTKTRKI